MLQEIQTTEFNGKTYDKRHGGAFDRGSADSYYNRPANPHYFSGSTYRSNQVHEVMMTQEQIDAYYAGYAYNEKFGDHKSWD